MWARGISGYNTGGLQKIRLSGIDSFTACHEKLRLDRQIDIFCSQ
jgi:hypothetical protein